MVRASKTMGVDPEVVLQGDTTQGVWGLEGPLRTLGTTFKSSAQKKKRSSFENDTGGYRFTLGYGHA